MAHQKSLSTLRTAVRDNVDESTASRWSNALLLRNINRAKDRVWVEVRKEREDYFVKTIESDDTNPTTILSESYDPTTMRVTVSGTSLTFPHDFVEVRLFEVMTSGYESVVFEFVRPDDVRFRGVRMLTDDQTPTLIYCAITNVRTVLIAPTSNTQLDTRLLYVFQPADLSADGDELQMPYPLDQAVEAYATATSLLQDFANESAVWEQRAKSIIADAIGAGNRQSQDPVIVAGCLE